MTCLLHDCRTTLSGGSRIQELLYADDTLLCGKDTAEMQRYMDQIAAEGAKYGLQLNYDKIEMMRKSNENNQKLVIRALIDRIL